MSDFGKDVADTFRSIKKEFTDSLAPPNEVNMGGTRKNLDKSIAEQVNSDLDKIIDKHDAFSSKKSIVFP